jgi:hypothetical protein
LSWKLYYLFLYLDVWFVHLSYLYTLSLNLNYFISLYSLNIELDLWLFVEYWNLLFYLYWYLFYNWNLYTLLYWYNILNMNNTINYTIYTDWHLSLLNNSNNLFLNNFWPFFQYLYSFDNFLIHLSFYCLILLLYF